MLFDDVMESVGCHVIYVHQDIREPRLIRARTDQDGVTKLGYDFESEELGDMLLPLLEAFGHGMLCSVALSVDRRHQPAFPRMLISISIQFMYAPTA